jgi:hypothetical protein
MHAETVQSVHVFVDSIVVWMTGNMSLAPSGPLAEPTLRCLPEGSAS